MPRIKPQRSFLTPPEIAAETGSRPETVILWIRSGELRGVDLSRRGSAKPRFRVRKEDFEDFLRRRAVATPAAPSPRVRRDTGVTQYV